MRFAVLVVSAGLAAAALLHGCGLGIVGIGSEDDASVGVGVDDAGTTNHVDAHLTDGGTGGSDANIIGTQDAAACGCALTPPSGWALLAWTADPSAACAGDLQPVDLITDPDGAAACGCSCTTTPPTCTSTKWSAVYDDTTQARCDLAAINDHTVTAGCLGDNGTFRHHAQIASLTPQGGTCNATSVPKPAALKATAVRICRPNGATCACDPSLGPKFTTCIAAKGDQACPAVAPTKHLVAGSADITCGGGCACGLDKSCKQTATYYSDGNCNTPIITVDSETCATAPDGTSYFSVQYAALPQASCTTTGNPSGSAKLADPSTVCCP